MRYNLIAIEGNIGSGKTTLAKKIAADFNAKLILESFADNPFLPKFYNQPDKFAFPLELFFMAERYQQLKTEVNTRELFYNFTLSDYMFTKSLIFAKVTLQDDEFKLYSRLYNIINPNLPVPELIIYLHTNVTKLLQNIYKRGRNYEQQIQPEYLQKIQDTYFDYFRQNQHLRVLVVDVSNADFLSEKKLYEKILFLIQKEYKPGMHFYELAEGLKD